MKDAENWRCTRAPPSPPLERVLLYYSKGVQCFLSSAGVIRPVLSSNRLDDEEIVLKFKIHRGDTVSSAFGRNNPLFLYLTKSEKAEKLENLNFHGGSKISKFNSWRFLGRRSRRFPLSFRPPNK